MLSHQQARTGRRRTASTVVAALLVAGVALAVLPGQRWRPSTWAASPIAEEPLARGSQHDAGGRLPGDRHSAAGVAEGEVPDGTTVFDDDIPAVANLDPALLGALRGAATEAARDGVELDVNSGWRAPSYQERLLDEAESKYGSREEAARWVATPQTSRHVSGDAVDIGPSTASAWLSTHGAEHGLCQIYRNEPWHYELRPAAVDHGCPATYADPTRDSRMQQ
jgi:D-alanyl-D-alanine carboxypeptidase